MTFIGYLCGDIKNIDSILEVNKESPKSFGCGHRPYTSSYRPELDITNELYAYLINRFQQIIGVLRWSIELGRMYIMTEVNFLYQILCSPRERHLNAVYKISRYLQKNLSNNPVSVVFDPACVHKYEKVFKLSII